MRVLLATPYFLPHIGGVENYVLSIAQGLRRLGVSVSVVTTQFDAHLPKEESLSEIQIFRLPVQLRVSNTPIHLGWNQMIKEVIERVRPDVVNAHLPVPYFADMAVRAAQSVSVPCVVTYHNDVTKDHPILQLISACYYQCLGNKTLEDASAVITTSQQYAQFSPHLTPFAQKVHIVPPGVTVVKSKHTVKLPKQYILFVGKLEKTHRHKGVDVLIEAFEHVQLRHPNLSLVIVGNGDDVARYQALAAEKKLSERIVMKQQVSDEELPDYYAGAVCLCLPSTSAAEGFGMVVLEAALQKTPSIGSRIGGIPQSIAEGETGLLVPHKDSEKLAESIAQLLEHPELLKKLGEAAYKRVTSSFLWDTQVEKTLQIFQAVAK